MKDGLLAAFAVCQRYIEEQQCLALSDIMDGSERDMRVRGAEEILRRLQDALNCGLPDEPR
jgi:hypothetical protein